MTPYTELRYFTGYEVSGDVVDVRYILTDTGMRYCIDSPAREIRAHILLPEGVQVRQVLLGGSSVAYETVCVADSRYVDFSAKRLRGRTDIEIIFD